MRGTEGMLPRMVIIRPRTILLICLSLKPGSGGGEATRSFAQKSKLRQNLCVSEEIFDVVNERDEVVDRQSRREVHARGLLHRAVHVLVFNARGQVFLQKRSMRKDKHPGVWDSSASGHVDSGEAYDTTAVREVREEIGLKLSQTPERLFYIAAGAETEQEFVWVYRSRGSQNCSGGAHRLPEPAP